MAAKPQLSGVSVRKAIAAAAVAAMVIGGTSFIATPANAVPSTTNPSAIYLWTGPSGCDGSSYFTAASNATGPHLTSITGDPGDILKITNRCGMTISVEFDEVAIAGSIDIEAGQTAPHTIGFGEADMDFFLKGAKITLYVTGSQNAGATVSSDGKQLNTPTNTPKFARPTAVKRSGSVVLLQDRVVLASGQTAKPHVSFARASDRSPVKRHGKVTVTKSGKVIVLMNAKRPTLITLNLSAPATDEYAAYRGGMTWLVK